MTDSPRAHAVNVLRALAPVHTIFRNLAAWLRASPGFSQATSDCSIAAEQRRDELSYDVGVGEGLRIEWFAEAEHESGAALSFAMSLSIDDGSDEWTITSAARCADRNGQHTLIELAERYAVDDDELAQELLGASAALAGERDRAMQVFTERYGEHR